MVAEATGSPSWAIATSTGWPTNASRLPFRCVEAWLVVVAQAESNSDETMIANAQGFLHPFGATQDKIAIGHIKVK